MSPKHIKFIWFGDIRASKSYQPCICSCHRHREERRRAVNHWRRTTRYFAVLVACCRVFWGLAAPRSREGCVNPAVFLSSLPPGGPGEGPDHHLPKGIHVCAIPERGSVFSRGETFSREGNRFLESGSVIVTLCKKKRESVLTFTLCYAIMLPGRKSGFPA